MVIKDFKELDWKIKFKDIKQMKKNEFANIVKRKLENKTFKDLVTRKEAHEKVKILKHPSLKMQQYFKTSDKQMKIEDSQNIFKMRCRVTHTKLNMKKLYDSHFCRACKIEMESDEHVYTCNEIMKMNKEIENIIRPEYEKLYYGNVNEQRQISRIFNSNMKIIQNIKEENVSTLLGPCDQICSASAVCTDTLYKLKWK